MKVEELEKIINHERSMGRAPKWLLDSLDEGKRGFVDCSEEKIDNLDDDLPEFIYPH